MPYYYHVKFGCNWTTNKGETELAPAYMVPKGPSLNRVKIGSIGKISAKISRDIVLFT